MNELDAAIMLIEKAKKAVRKPNHFDYIHWAEYQDDLRIARKLLLDMYLDTASYSNGITKKQIAGKLRGERYEDY